MKFYIVIISILFTLTSYGQNTNTTQKTSKEVNNIDSNDILEGDPYLKKLQKFDYEPEYQIEVESYYAYDIRINDMPITSQRPPLGQTMNFPINSYILKSGLQDLSFNIYPRFINDDTEQKEFLEDPQRINFKIFIRQTAWINGSREEYKEVFSYILSEDKKEIKNITEKKQLFKKFTFKAKVPFELEGWSNSTIFKPKDSVELEKKVFDFYQKYRKLMEDRDGIKLKKTSLNKGWQIAQGYYFTREEVIKSRKKWLGEFPLERFKMANIKDQEYKLVFYGDNRVLGLVFNDPIEKGESAMVKVFKDKDDELAVTYYSLLLHQPKGSDTLEIIR